MNIHEMNEILKSLADEACPHCGAEVVVAGFSEAGLLWEWPDCGCAEEEEETYNDR